MARKTKYASYVEPYLDQIEAWVKQGDTHKSIARKLNISHDTLERYIKRGESGEEPFCDLSVRFIHGEMETIKSVEDSLYKRAKGYQWTEVINRYRRDPETGELYLYEVRERLVDVPPDPTSIIFFLTNRKRADWQKDRKGSIQEDRDELGVIRVPEVEG